MESKPFVVHFRFREETYNALDCWPSPRGGVTIVLDEKGQYGFALCSPKDNFCRRKGRIIAEGRYRSGRYQYGSYGSAPTPETLRSARQLAYLHLLDTKWGRKTYPELFAPRRRQRKDEEKAAVTA